MNNTFSCICPPGYSGLQCTNLIGINVISPCASSPCGPKKFCADLNSTSYTCNCPPGFTGDYCELRVRSCASFPCGNGGQCIEDLFRGGFTCNCPVGKTGLLCDIVVNVCASSPCANNSTCVQTGINSFRCEILKKRLK